MGYLDYFFIINYNHNNSVFSTNYDRLILKIISYLEWYLKVQRSESMTDKDLKVMNLSTNILGECKFPHIITCKSRSFLHNKKYNHL